VVAQQNWASVVAAGARVADDAVLVESVVMPGATVGAGAVVVRSVLCEGAEVRAGASCVDRVVGPSGPLTDAQAAVPWSARRRRG
jgi:ADP-glucose pyrophosphorylase